MDSQNPGVQSKIICPRCGNEVRSGGHSDNLGFSFRYCQACDNFVARDSFGMESQEMREIQDFLGATFRGKNQSPINLCMSAPAELLQQFCSVQGIGRLTSLAESD